MFWNNKMESPSLRMHGGVEDEEVLDFSENLNPYGPPQDLLEEISKEGLRSYPKSLERETKIAIAKYVQTSADRIVLGAGACDLLWSIAFLLLKKNKTNLIVEPTFSEFPTAIKSYGGGLSYWWASKENNFEFDLSSINTFATKTNCQSIYLCNPNNPTGVSLSIQQISSLAENQKDKLLILDESFRSLSTLAKEDHVDLPENTIRVRSLTKDTGVAGLRIAYAIATPDLVLRIENSRRSWPLSSQQLCAIKYYPKIEKFIEESRLKLMHESTRLKKSLSDMGHLCFDSSTNFFLMELKNAALYDSHLLEKGLALRNCESFGLHSFLRVGAKRPKDGDCLIRAMEKLSL